jgi:hypothetical protein
MLTGAVPPTAGQLVTSERGVCGDPWLSITLNLCHILHSVSHWPVLVYFIKILKAKQFSVPVTQGDLPQFETDVGCGLPGQSLSSQVRSTQRRSAETARCFGKATNT